MLAREAETAMLLDTRAAEGEQRPAFDLAEKFWLARPYFSDEIAQEIVDRFTDHAETWSTVTPVASAVWQAYRTYHGLQDGSDEPTVSLVEAGEHGEFLALTVNHFRGLLRHQIALVTADRPTWDPQARTSGADAAKQVSLTRSLLDYIMSAKRFDQKLYDQFELAGVAASAFQALGWDANAAGGRGDLWSSVLAPWEICHEKVREYSDTTWWIFRRMENRWSWVAHFAESDPEKAERLATHSFDEDLMCGVETESMSSAEESDRIPVLYLYANPTRACPLGRLTAVAGAEKELVLLDGPMPYGDESPITRICPAEFVGTSIPYANSWSQLPIMQAFNAVISTIMSRVDLFGVPNVASTEGTEFEAGDISGANSIKVPPGADKPEVIDLLTLPNALPGFAESLKKYMEELTGINSVTRGNPTENITSGSMAALLQSMAIQFNSADERSYTFNLEAIGTHVLRIYQRMASNTQMIAIAGQDEQWTVREFQGEDLRDMLRVSVKTANALSRNIAGRKEIADNLLNAGLVRDPREYLQVVHTGELSPLFRGPVNELTCIKSENEMLLRGEKPEVSVWDNHELHIREHRGELDTKARYDKALSAGINDHLQEHYMLWGELSRTDPDRCRAIGYQPLQMALMVGQAALQAQGMPGGMQTEGPPATETPHAAPSKGKPGPAPKPPGQEQPTAAPNQPKPAQSPNGAPV